LAILDPSKINRLLTARVLYEELGDEVWWVEDLVLNYIEEHKVPSMMVGRMPITRLSKANSKTGSTTLNLRWTCRIHEPFTWEDDGNEDKIEWQ
jgi:hypothetical protein